MFDLPCPSGPSSRGGRRPEHRGHFIRSGAAAVGVGNSLINQKLLDSGDMGELTRRAVAFIKEVKKGKGG